MNHNNLKSKDVVAGLGEIGTPIFQLFSKSNIVVGYDIDPKLINKKKFEKYQNFETRFLHICIPYNDNFVKNIMKLSKKFSPKCIVIQSTIPPRTTKTIQNSFDIPIIYSATRGLHKRMLRDLYKYTKFFAIENTAPKAKWACIQYKKLLNDCNVKSKQMSKPLTLELAKIVCDTSYYGWLINYAQLSNMIAIENGINYDEMWSFADEIHKFLGNRPKMYPGFIGGHCVIPNLKLMHNQTLDLIKEINNTYLKKVPKAKSINKKYEKSKKQSYDV